MAFFNIKAKGIIQQLDYKYDQNSRRIQKTVSNAVTNYTYDGDSNRVLFETDGTGKLIHSYAYDAKDQLVCMTDQQGAVYYYLLNGHGDVTGLTDSFGNIVAQYEYDSWGNLISKSGAMADANPYRYAGYRYDNETGLYYLMARYYNADTGNFLSKDTDGGDKDKPLTENGYAYANNNPEMNVDPDGDIALALKSEIIVSAIILLGLASFVRISQNSVLWLASNVGSKVKKKYLDVKKGQSTVNNRKTDVSKREFEKILKRNGWKHKKAGKVDIFTKNGAKYVTRGFSKSEGPTADFYPRGSKGIFLKIRLRR